MTLSREHRCHRFHCWLIAGIAACGILYPQSLNTASDDLRVRVSVTLVQVDAVVTDAHGNHVPADLAPGDYFLQEEVISQPRNGKPVRAWQWAELRVEPK